MNKYILLSLAFALSFCAGAQVNIDKLRTENSLKPAALDVRQPRFSWQLQSGKRAVMQTAYELEVTDEAGKKIWQPGKVASQQSVLVRYGGPALQSGAAYRWRVRVWDNDGKVSAWSAPAGWQMGLLKQTDWTAKWIEPGFAEECSRPSPLMRKEFNAGKKIAKATAYITAHGLYEAHINGKRVGDTYLTPGWTSYKTRLQYQAYDVTDLLQQGTNTVGVALGNGWYRGVIGFSNNMNVYGKDIALLMQINIRYSDGSAEIIGTDESWKSSTGAIRYSEIYNGEKRDNRLEKRGWADRGFDDRAWSGVKLGNHPKDEHIRIKPLTGGNFTNASASLETYYGTVKSGWRKEGNNFQLDVQIPANTQASVFVPAVSAAEVQEGGVVLNKAKDIQFVGSKDGYVELLLGSGNYSFRAPITVSAATSMK